VRYLSRLHHVGIGCAYNHQPITLLIGERPALRAQVQEPSVWNTVVGQLAPISGVGSSTNLSRATSLIMQTVRFDLILKLLTRHPTM
jgi:hypothetical protein